MVGAAARGVCGLLARRSGAGGGRWKVCLVDGAGCWGVGSKRVEDANGCLLVEHASMLHLDDDVDS